MTVSPPLRDERLDGSEALASAYLRVRQASVDLTDGLTPEDCVIQTLPEVSPTKWHLAHTTWFFEQFCLLQYFEGYREYSDKYLYLFNSYYHTVGPMHARPLRGLLNRPSLSEVLDYRAHVDDAMVELIDTNDSDELRFLVALGSHHEQQHQELMLTDIKHVLFTNPMQAAYAQPAPAATGEPTAHKFVARPGGRFTIGHADDTFCFDNETPPHDVLVDEHELGNRLVTNGEYKAFIESGGYRDVGLWLADGWARIKSDGWDRPLYWAEDLEREFTLSGWQTLDPAAPVCHISQYEADAFARWSEARLPTEAEWELAARNRKIAGNTLDRGLLHPTPVRDAEQDDIHQLWGDVWEWTASPYIAYPGFKPLAGSLGEYNGKFMSSQIVVRGGSCASWADHLRATYRSFFYPQDRWQFLGLRLARTVD